MRVLYFGSYSLNNPRNAVLIKGLRANGIEVLECRDTSRFFLLRCARLFLKYLKFIGRFDVMIVGFSGQELMFLARLLTFKPIIFDVFTSHYMGYILDRKYFSPRSWRAKYYHFLDEWSCQLADKLLLDTQAHIDYFVKEFDLPKEKFHRIWLGANTEQFQSRPAAKTEQFSVIFWGNFIPLQGVEYMIRAAKILENEPIQFTFIGDGGQTFEANKKLSEELGLKNVKFPGKLEWDDLHQAVAQADVCLGAFSDSIKADVTIQNKIFETLASGKALITARTAAVQELLKDGENCLMVNKADPEDLAEKILRLKNDAELKEKIAANGLNFFQENLTEKKLGEMLVKVL
ncbi:MAG: glycosyltransferase [bacterium]|nr:glycosyltransferase [bacterium]